MYRMICPAGDLGVTGGGIIFHSQLTPGLTLGLYPKRLWPNGHPGLVLATVSLPVVYRYFLATNMTSLR